MKYLTLLCLGLIVALFGVAYSDNMLTVTFTPLTPQTNAQALQFACTNNAWTINLVMNVQTQFNNENPALPTDETGLPVIDMNWYINAAPATTLTVTNATGVNYATTIQPNIFQFQLKDNHPNIDAIFAVGTCTVGQTQPPIQVAFVPNQAIIDSTLAQDIAVTTVNNFNAANQFIAGVTVPTTTTATLAPTVAPTVPATTLVPTMAPTIAVRALAQTNMMAAMQPVLIGVGGVVAVGAVVGTALGVKAFRARKIGGPAAHVPLADAI